LICDFPFTQFTDEEIIDLFSKCGFSLGIIDSIRIKIVQHFRKHSKQNLAYVQHGIMDKLDNTSPTHDIDLSVEVLALVSIINT
jgi:hypothetical protein